MREPELKNARISGTMLGIEDHGMLTAFVYLEYAGGGQGFGGYVLGRCGNPPKPGPAAEIFIDGVLKVLEVDKWESLKGVSCRVLSSPDKVHEIGHFLKDQWFNPSKEFEHLDKKGE